MLRPAPPIVTIAIRAKPWRGAVPDLRRRARSAALAALRGANRAEPMTSVELSFVDDAAIAQLNQAWRGKVGPTNVLSFPAPAGATTPGQPRSLGDVILAAETCLDEAARDGKTPGDHVSHLVVHGVLHLLGFDHVKARDATKMEALETHVLAGLGIADPYAKGAQS